MQHRTYLWLYLAFESIKETLRDNLRPSEESINYLPSSVEDAYEKILSKVGNNKTTRFYVTKVLQITVGARRPLTVGETAIALGIATSSQITALDKMRLNESDLENRIRQLCGLFVCFSNSKIFLIHQTAKEFLICKQGSTTTPGLWRHCLVPVEVESEMARICVEFMLLEDVQEAAKKYAILLEHEIAPSEGDASTCFCIYSGQNWANHFGDGPSFAEEWMPSKVLRLYNNIDGPFNWWALVFSHTLYDRGFNFKNVYYVAAWNGHEGIMELLLDDSISSVNYTNTDLINVMVFASRLGRIPIVSLLLDRGVDINAQASNGLTALHAALTKHKRNMMEFLLHRGANIDFENRDGETALHRALPNLFQNSAEQIDCYQTVKLLLDRGANVNADNRNGQASLYKAIRPGAYELVKLLLDRNADINSRSRYGTTALHTASFKGLSDIIELLLDRGADIEAEDYSGRTTLREAVAWGSYKLIQILLDRGANINHQDYSGCTALRGAVVLDRRNVVELPLDRGADINIQDEMGNTVLHTAVSGIEFSDVSDLIELLVDRGVDVNAQNHDHLTALTIATRGSMTQSVTLLRSRGAVSQPSDDFDSEDEDQKSICSGVGTISP